MSMASSADTVVVRPAAAAADHHSYVDWGAIIGGIVLASAISLLMLTFGSAIGLSFANFHGGTGVSPIWIAIAAASWLLWVQVSSMMAGGYLTGRLRRRADDATEHEVDVRDGAHGLLVWGGALLVAAVVAVSGIGAAANAIGSAVSAAGSVAGTAATTASNVAGKTNAGDPTAYFVDTMFRPNAPAAGAPAPAAPNPAALDAAKGEVSRILVNDAATGQVSDPDKAYLASVVSQTTGLSQADAQNRINTVLGQIDAAKAKALDAAETARKTGVLAAFLTAASLLISAVGAYWAASMGGRHRDEGTVFADVFRRY